MPPKKTNESAEPAEAPRRSTRVASKPPPSKKEEPVAPAKKPASTKAKKPASKAEDKVEATKAPAKAPASKKRAAEDAPAKAPASKKAKETKDGDAAEKPKSTKSATKPASTKAAAEKPASKKPASTKAATSDKPASKAASASAKPASKKPASKAATGDKPKSTAKPKSKKVDTIAEEKDVDMDAADKDPKGKSEGEKKEIEAAAEGSEPDASGALKEGETLPKITLKDNKDQDVDISTLVTADHGVIFFTYPKANTPGCTSQACNFRDSYEDFGKLGYKIYGLSTDSPKAQESWNEEKKFGYPLLSDPNSEFIKKLGAFSAPKNTIRAHFIFEKGTGKLLEAKTKVKPADDAKNCLNFIKKHHSA